MIINKPVSHHYITVQGKQIHYRRCGHGPVIVLFHDSPNSSRLMVPMMHRMAELGFTTIAPDTPGYGLSDPLDSEESAITIPAIASFFSEVILDLGIQSCAVYGFHTGAVIAATLAALRPDLVSGCAMNGYPVFSQAEMMDLQENYLPPFTPSWDGGHLTWLWARLREQSIFFPWYRKDMNHRLDFDMPTAEVTQEFMDDFLRAGDGYRDVYGAVFRVDTLSILSNMRCPALILASRRDPLSAHIPRLPSEENSNIDILVVDGGPPEALDRAAEWLSTYSQRAFISSAMSRRNSTSSAAIRDFVLSDGGQLHSVHHLGGKGRPLVLLHDLGSSSGTYSRNQVVHEIQAPWIAFDLPFHGESATTCHITEPTVEAVAAEVWSALERSGLTEFDLRGMNLGAQVAAELKRNHPSAVGNMNLHSVRRPINADCFHDDTNSVDWNLNLEPRWDGGHLLTVWHMLRQRHLFDPWFRTRRQNIIWKEYSIDTLSIHRDACDLLKARKNYREMSNSFALYEGRSEDLR